MALSNSRLVGLRWPASAAPHAQMCSWGAPRRDRRRRATLTLECLLRFFRTCLNVALFLVISLLGLALIAAFFPLLLIGALVGILLGACAG